MTATSDVRMYPVLSEALDEYLDYLDHDGVRIQLPFSPRNPEDTAAYAWASNIGWCPLKSVLRRLKIEPWIEEDIEQQRKTRFKMAAGGRVAEMIQEAMWWKYSQAARPEVGIVNEELQVKGRMDIDFQNGSERIVLEIKTSAYSQPSWGHVVQTLIYMVTTNADRAYIVLANPFDVNGSVALNCWRIEAHESGYVVYNEETGDLWNSKRNGAEFLNLELIRQAIETHREYIDAIPDGVVIDQENLPYYVNPPFALDGEDAWQCFRMPDKDKPHRYEKKYTYHKGEPDEHVYQAGEVRLGVATPTCPFFCHGNIAGAFPVNLEKDPETGVDREVYLIHQEVEDVGNDGDVALF